MDKITIESIRKELEEMDAAYAALPFHPDEKTNEQQERLNAATLNMDINLAAKLHLLLDKIGTMQEILESIALNAPQNPPNTQDVNRNYAMASNFHFAGKLAGAALQNIKEPQS